MELNEKIAARRRELAIEAEIATQAEHERQKQKSIAAAKAKKAAKDAIDAEVDKRLAERGITPTAAKVLPKSTKAPSLVDPSATKINWSDTRSTATETHSSLVDTEVEKAISKAASARMTGGENSKFIVLLLLGIGGFFIAWWVGLVFVVWAFAYLSKTTTRHKEQIIAEGKAKLASAQTEGVS